MKKFIAVLVILGLIIILISIHIFATVRFSNQMETVYDNVYSELANNNWDKIQNYVSDIEEIWNSKQSWLSLTLNINKIEQIETAIEQCKKFAEYEERPDFIDKLSTLSKLTENIPYQEGLRIENLF